MKFYGFSLVLNNKTIQNHTATFDRNCGWNEKVEK
jgi:hypothetical protein